MEMKRIWSIVCARKIADLRTLHTFLWLHRTGTRVTVSPATVVAAGSAISRCGAAASELCTRASLIASEIGTAASIH
jgi:hypothetical protein